MAKGRTLGAALLALADESGFYPRRTSYNKTGWHAQLSKLTDSVRGYQALDKAGLDVKPRTLVTWLSDAEYPVRKGYREQINAAYQRLAGGRFPDRWRTKTFAISGRVTMGTDTRERGSEGHAPLRINGTQGVWDRIETGFRTGRLTTDQLEEYFTEDVIYPDIGPGAEYMDFDGTSYQVT